jgi:hypothetical protein
MTAGALGKFREQILEQQMTAKPMATFYSPLSVYET